MEYDSIMDTKLIVGKDVYHHIYNRGAHKADIFLDGSDYVRMLKLLYIANNDEPFVLSRLPDNVFNLPRKHILVEIVAYCLMPNHIHIALKNMAPELPGIDDNVTKFMHKLTTGYSAYFNKKYRHSGTIWQGTYKEKTVYDGLYIKTLIDYIHLNPRVLRDNSANINEDTPEKLEFAMNYEYSSIKDYAGIARLQSSILNACEISRFRA